LRILALDYGARRVGVALSDPTGMFAQPLETLRARGPRDPALLAALARRIEEFEVDRIVIGLPLHMDGRSGTQADETRAFGERLGQHAGLPVDYVDERWTTRAAQRMSADLGRGRRSRDRVDAIAASLILQVYLDRASRETPPQ